jgi:putative transposase
MYGCPKIALLASNVLSISVDQCLVRRILLKQYKPTPGNDPSWLLPIGWKADKLWSLDFFRVESINLKTHWVMVVMDQFSRKIIGFSVHGGALDGPTACYMFNSVLSGNTLPSNLSSDNDPLFLYHRWLANLEELEIEEIKSIPFTPTSHPFIERLILTVRQEFTNKIFFWSKDDLEKKLECYKEYYNDYRVHYSLGGSTPAELYEKKGLECVELGRNTWKSVCNGMFYTPIAA